MVFVHQNWLFRPPVRTSFVRREYSVDQNSDLLLDQKLSNLFITCNVRTRQQRFPRQQDLAVFVHNPASAFKPGGLFKHFMRWNWLEMTGLSTFSGCHADVKSHLQGGTFWGAHAHTDRLVRTRTGLHWVAREESTCVTWFFCVSTFRESVIFEPFRNPVLIRTSLDSL